MREQSQPMPRLGPREQNAGSAGRFNGFLKLIFVFSPSILQMHSDPAHCGGAAVAIIGWVID